MSVVEVIRDHLFSMQINTYLLINTCLVRIQIKTKYLQQLNCVLMKN